MGPKWESVKANRAQKGRNITKTEEKPLPAVGGIIAYHGTLNTFEEFHTEPDQFKSLWAGDPGAGMLGAFFTDNQEFAKTYPPSVREGTKRIIIKACLDIRNPKEYKNLSELRKAMKRTLGNEFLQPVGTSSVSAAKSNALKFKRLLIDKGYDGIVFGEGPGHDPTNREKQAKTYVARSNKQIKILHETRKLNDTAICPD